MSRHRFSRWSVEVGPWVFTTSCAQPSDALQAKSVLVHVSNGQQCCRLGLREDWEPHPAVKPLTDPPLLDAGQSCAQAEASKDQLP